MTLLLVECYKYHFSGVTILKNLRRRFELFCYNNRSKGIPNLMLYIALGSAVVYLMSEISGNYFLYSLLYFDRSLILQGQIWRLITYPLTYRIDSLLLMMVSLLCYYSIGRAMENIWGTLRFNLFYFLGLIGSMIAGMITGYATSYYINLSMFLAVAILYPMMQINFYGIIPIRMKWLALIDLSH